MYDSEKHRRSETTDPERDLLACMRGEYGPGWYLLGWVGGLTLPTLIILGVISVVVPG